MDYDELVHSKDIQILKSMLPFIDRQQQMPLAIMIQFIEFQNALRLFQDKEKGLSANTIHNEEERQMAMLQALMKHFSTEEQETINNMMNMINMMSMMNTEDFMENVENFI
jgi:hypothetical protein